jgi:hypothetical protein
VAENHADDLQRVYRKVLLLCAVAALARDIKHDQRLQRQSAASLGMSETEFCGFVRRSAETTEEDDNDENGSADPSVYSPANVEARVGLQIRTGSDPSHNNWNESQRRSMLEMLGSWYVDLSVLNSPVFPSHHEHACREEPEAEAEVEVRWNIQV